MKIVNRYHLLENSPWPIITSITLLNLLISTIIGMNGIIPRMIIINMIGVIISILLWIREINIESEKKGEQTKEVKKGIYKGLILFIISETILFITFFYSYFFNTLIPSIELDNNIQTQGIILINPISIPLLNTILLYLSGITSNISYNKYKEKKKRRSIIYLIITIILGIIFSLYQFIEYKEITFTYTDTIIGSLFFLLTGFHSLHVIIGLIFLSFTLYFLLRNTNPYIFISYSNLYWHFVDYVWLFLYLFLYCWPTL